MNQFSDAYPDIDRSNFVRYNPVFLKSIFGRTDVLPFWVADTDFEVMPKLKEALAARAELGLFGYETKSPTLKQGLADWYKRRYTIDINSRRLLFMPSVNASIAAIIDELSQPGDGVIIQPPVYQAFQGIISGLGREVVNNQLLFSNNRYTIDFDDLQQQAQKKETKIMVFCSPHNPVGRVWHEEELVQVARICHENDVLLITDEIHGDIVYPPHTYRGMTEIAAGYGDNIIMVSSAGKTFGMPGLVDSFIYTPNKGHYGQLKKRLERYHLDKGNAFAHVAWEAVYQHGDQWLDQMIAYLQENVRTISEFLTTELPEITMPVPEGTYQVWLNFAALQLSNDDLQKFLVEKAGLALNRGHTYGPGGEGFARMNIASPRTLITKAMVQLKEAVHNI